MACCSTGNKTLRRALHLLLQRGMASNPQVGGGRTKRQRLLAPSPSVAASGGAASGSRRGKPTPGAAKYKELGPGIIDLGSGAAVLYRTDLLGAQEADNLFQQLRHGVPWEQRNVRVMGREVAQPRLTFLMADSPDLQYTYSGTTFKPAAWHPAVAAVKARMEVALGPGTPPFNTCLLNYYRSGQDSIAWHSDNEPLFGRHPTIASLSLGAPREFLLRCNANHDNKYRFRLGGGAVLVMSGTVQEQWMHSVPRRAQLVGERISLTFRRVVLPEDRKLVQQAQEPTQGKQGPAPT